MADVVKGCFLVALVLKQHPMMLLLCLIHLYVQYCGGHMHAMILDDSSMTVWRHTGTFPIHTIGVPKCHLSWAALNCCPGTGSPVASAVPCQSSDACRHCQLWLALQPLSVAVT